MRIVKVFAAFLISLVLLLTGPLAAYACKSDNGNYDCGDCPAGTRCAKGENFCECEKVNSVLRIDETGVYKNGVLQKAPVLPKS